MAVCSWVKVNGIPVIIRGRDRLHGCIVCGEISTRQCDWKEGRGTCDRHLCDNCTTEPAEDKDLCPDHAKAWADHPANQQERLPI